MIRFILSGILLLVAFGATAQVEVSTRECTNNGFSQQINSDFLCSDIQRPVVPSFTTITINGTSGTYDFNDSLGEDDEDKSTLIYGACGDTTYEHEGQILGHGCPITWSATGLPSGVSINASTGVIDASSYAGAGETAAITVTATSFQGVDSETGNLTITTGGSDITANLVSRTRVDLLSGEMIMVDAAGSACSDCTDVWGLGTTEAVAQSVLSYYFTFDDGDAGTFATTGRSANIQAETSSSTASHYYECDGATDPDWNGATSRCESTISVRVTAPDGDYGDATLDVSIQPLYGTGGYYADADIYCVSSTSSFGECVHSVVANHLTDVPAPDNNNYDEKLLLIHNNGATYSDVCVGADERNFRGGTYGTGSRPVVPLLVTSGNVNDNCNANFLINSGVPSSSFAPEKDVNGHVIDGYGFNSSAQGWRLGEYEAGTSSMLNGIHDMDMDWSASGTYSSQITVAAGGDGCLSNATDCVNIPYPYGFFVSETTAWGNDANLPGLNINGLNGAMPVNSTIIGNDLNRAVEHTIRIMGMWRLLVAENWLRGNHVSGGGAGGGGGKHRATLRSGRATGDSLDKERVPDDFTVNPLHGRADIYRGDLETDKYFNKYNNVINNKINQTTHDPEHNSAAWLHLFGDYFVVENNEFIDDSLGDGTLVQVGGSYITVRDQTWPAEATNTYCTLINGGGFTDENIQEWPDANITATLNAARDELTIAFGSNTSQGAEFALSDLNIVANGTTVNFTSTVSGDGTASHTYALSRVVDIDEEPVLNFTGGANSLEATSDGADIDDFVGYRFLSSSTIHFSLPNADECGSDGNWNYALPANVSAGAPGS